MSGIGNIVGGFSTMGMWILLLSWPVLLAFLVWAPVKELRREGRPVVVMSATVVDVLRERLERGEISSSEFEDALCMLRDS